MRLLKTLPLLSVLFLGLMTSCSKEQDEISQKSANDEISQKSATISQKSANSDASLSTMDGINLGLAGDFVILSKTGITDVYKSDVTGDVGSSPITGAAILLKCNEVTGTIYSVDAAGPIPCRITDATRLTTAVSNMQTAYTDAAGRVNPDFLNLGAGTIGGNTLTPGLYKWTSALDIPTDITISGNATDVWIFQVAGNLTMGSAVRVTLEGGAQAKNIFWQTAGAVTLGTTSHFEGNILSQTGINLKTAATINGRMFAQTAVTLQMNTVSQPQ